MGLDLTLMPFSHDDDEWGCSHEMLELPRDYELFERIQRLPTTSVPLKFATYRSIKNGIDPQYGETQETPYGEPLLATTIAHLKTCQIPGPHGAFVAASPDNQRVALYCLT